MFGIKPVDKTKITLPSNGYIDGVPQEVLISPLTGRHEIKMNTVSLTSYIDYIINECVTDTKGEKFDSSLLLPADKTYIMFMIRSITYSNEFISEYVCRNPECGRVVKPTINLEELEVSKLLANPAEALTNIDLGDDITVTLKLLNDAELGRLEFESKQMSNKLKGARSAEECYNLLYMMRSIKEFSYVNEEGTITVVNGEEPSERPTVQTLVEVLPAKSISLIRNTLSSANDFGVALATYHKCEHCSTVNVAPVSLVTTEFFRPSNT